MPTFMKVVTHMYTASNICISSMSVDSLQDSSNTAPLPTFIVGLDHLGIAIEPHPKNQVMYEASK